MITVGAAGEVTIQFTAHIRPKGSHTALTSKSTGRAIVVDQDRTGQRIEKAVRAALKAECEAIGFVPLTGPLKASGRVWYKKPRTSKLEYPYEAGDLDKLVRRLLDICGGNRTDPGPVLANDKYVRAFGAWESVWTEDIGRDDDGAIVQFTPMPPRRVRLPL